MEINHERITIVLENEKERSHLSTALCVALGHLNSAIRTQTLPDESFLGRAGIDNLHQVSSVRDFTELLHASL